MIINKYFFTAFVLFAGAFTLTGTTEIDSRIEAKAKESYNFHTILGDTVVATVKGGIVTLTGTVEDKEDSEFALATIKNLADVKGVINHIIISPEMVEQSDEWMETKIRALLLMKSNTESKRTEVDDEGVVTLTGTASSMAQKELTTEYVKDVKGVKSVVNKMKVEPAKTEMDPIADENIDDASIVAQVKVLLIEHRSTKAIKTTVKVEKGVVTITGIAKNDAEKSMISKLVSDVNGVNKVINDMTIEVPSPEKK